MTSIKRVTLPLAAVCIALGAFLASTTGAYAFALPDINDSGKPVFINSVKVRVNTKNQTVKVFTNGSGRGFQLFDGTNFISGSGSFTLNARYTGDGIFESGTVQIKGSIEEYGIFGGGNVLMSADLDSWNNIDDSRLWGFNTNNLVCLAALEAAVGPCSTGESVFIVLNSDFNGFDSRFTSTGTAHTTIPVPAAAWLFGSALGLLGWVRRRQRRLDR